MAAQRTDEEQRLKRNVEERQREKQEEARARDKIRLKLGPSPPASCLYVLPTKALLARAVMHTCGMTVARQSACLGSAAWSLTSVSLAASKIV